MLPIPPWRSPQADGTRSETMARLMTSVEWYLAVQQVGRLCISVCGLACWQAWAGDQRGVALCRAAGVPRVHVQGDCDQFDWGRCETLDALQTRCGAGPHSR